MIKTIRELFYSSLLLTAFLTFESTKVQAQTLVNYESGPSNSEINAALEGPGVSISGGTLHHGDRNQQIALFDGGLAAGLEQDGVVFFGTGRNYNLLGSTNNKLANNDWVQGMYQTGYYDPDLVAIESNAIYDVVSYSFDVKIANNATKLSITYQFGSEEYPDYVGTRYNDVFGFFISGPGINGTENLAKLPNGNPTTVNKVNYGIRGIEAFNPLLVPDLGFDGSQSDLYVKNGHTTNTSFGGWGTYINRNTNPGPFPVAVQFNGLTKSITFGITRLTPGETYRFKIAVADTFDGRYDCGVFVKQNSIIATADIIANDDYYTVDQGTTTPSVLENDTYNGGTANTSNVNVSGVSVPNGFTLNNNGTISVGSNVEPGTYEVLYQICDAVYPTEENLECDTATAYITVEEVECTAGDVAPEIN